MEVIMNLHDLIKARIAVNESIDITSKLARDNPISWLKTVVGFAITKEEHYTLELAKIHLSL